MKKKGIFVSLFMLGMIVYFAGGYWAAIPSFWRTVIKCALPPLLLASAYLCGRSASLRKWRGVLIALMAAAIGFMVSWFLNEPLLNLTGTSADTIPGISLAKVFESLLIVVPAYLAARAAGITNSQMYLQRGKLKAWMIVGIGAFAIFSALFLAQVFGSGIEMTVFLSILPWALLFVFANGFMEEFHFRGLLLEPFEKMLGKHGANLCIALFFTLIHAPVQYTPDIVPFLVILFGLALVWGYLIQKTESLWGSVLFHAGADLMIVAGIFETYSN